MLEIQKLFQSCADKEFELGASETNMLFRLQLKEIGVDVRDYPEHKMFLLDYNQIEAIKNHPVVNECRGLLMGYDGQIIRKGFTRFYNLGENGVDEFDFENSIAFEKADGSLCLSAETELVTDSGNKTIKEICDSKFSGKVLGLNHDSGKVEFTDIQGHLITENSDDWYEIELEDGKTLKVTGDHKIWSPVKREYIKVKNLSIDDEVLILELD